MRPDLAEYVRTRRLLLGLSRGGLAEAVGTSRRSIEVLEGGSDITAWPVSQLLDLAEALGVAPAVFLSDGAAPAQHASALPCTVAKDAEIRLLAAIATGRFTEQRLSDADRRALGVLLASAAVSLVEGRYELSPEAASSLGLGPSTA